MTRKKLPQVKLRKTGTKNDELGMMNAEII
jgi:hypothetical protein